DAVGRIGHGQVSFPVAGFYAFPVLTEVPLERRSSHDPTSRSIGVSQRGPHGRPEAHRADRDPRLSRYLGAPRSLQARSQPHHGGGPDGDVPSRPAQGPHRAGPPPPRGPRRREGGTHTTPPLPLLRRGP